MNTDNPITEKPSGGRLTVTKPNLAAQKADLLCSPAFSPHRNTTNTSFRRNPPLGQSIKLEDPSVYPGVSISVRKTERRKRQMRKTRGEKRNTAGDGGGRATRRWRDRWFT